MQSHEGLLSREKAETSRFVIDILQYRGSSERIWGYRKLQECGLITPKPIFVLTHDAFEEYKNRGMTEELQTQILNAFQGIREKNPNRGVFLGWRTVLPGGELPPGPRTAAIYDEKEYLAAVKKAWSFARERHDIEGAEITLVLHPFIHAAEPPMIKEPFLQWPGGDVTPLPDGRISIRATWGPDEVVQGYPCDKYTTQLKRDGVNIGWEISHKTTTLRPYKGKYVETSIPSSYQNQQTLSVSQIFEIAKAHQKVTQGFGPHRLEWIAQKEGVIFRECAPFEVKPEHFFFLEEELSQPVIVLTSEKDIERITPPSAIIHLPAEIFKDRSIVRISSLLAAYAKTEGITLVVLSHGSIATQHMVRRFRDFGQSVLFVGDERLEGDEIIRIFRDEKGRPRWERVERRQNNIIDLEDTEAMQRASSKARNLSILHEQGFPVPQGFYLTEKLFEQHLAFLELEQAIKELEEFSGESLWQKSQAVQRKILESKLSNSLRRQIKRRLEELPDGRFSIRSAEAHEDGEIAKAGLFTSYIGVDQEEVPDEILECWASCFSPHTIEYLRATGIAPSEIKMGVLIHEWIEGKGGVIYTEPDIVISAGESPEAITSGTEENPHKITIKRGLEREILIEEFPPEGPILSSEERRELVDLALQIEKILDISQDIEWVISPEGKITILQSRPL